MERLSVVALAAAYYDFHFSFGWNNFTARFAV